CARVLRGHYYAMDYW
nr:immunoglobulin heavy chain junction region [Mus musculus]